MDHPARAIGLWLWDYVEKEFGQHPPGGHKLAHAIDKLIAKYGKPSSVLAKIGKESSEKATFRKLYHRTNACIVAGDVLTLK